LSCLKFANGFFATDLPVVRIQNRNRTDMSKVIFPFCMSQYGKLADISEPQNSAK